MEAIRLNKYLSEAGLCSRREADRMIQEGRVFVDGRPALSGEKVTDQNRILVDGKTIARKEKPVYLAVNKPAGIVCSTKNQGGERNCIVDFLQYPKRIYPVGRLDKDSEGLIIMTNQGDILNKMMRSGNYHEKEYEVTVNRSFNQQFLKKMSEGVEIIDKEKGLHEITRPCIIERLGPNKFRIILTQGLNRQIRRMCQALGYQVTKLERVRIMNIRLGHLQRGGYRNLTEAEIATLYQMLADSSSEPLSMSKEQ